MCRCSLDALEKWAQGRPTLFSLQQWEGHMFQWAQPQESQILWLKVTLCPPVLLSASHHPQVGGENVT